MRPSVEILIHGDSREVLRELAPDCMDSMVTDPPAGISFMGRNWDTDKGGRAEWIAWLAGVMRECLRVLKPGGHGLVWALPRTSHWTATALEDAGFQVRDRVSHLFGTGFPKSLSVGEGRGTALKPACEDWWLVRKPLDGTVVANLRNWGTGALNIDACRVGAWSDFDKKNMAVSRRGRPGMFGLRGSAEQLESHTAGRWPAHFTLDESAAALLDAQSGELRARGNQGKSKAGGGMYGHGLCSNSFGAGDSGGASRFFYVAKASRKERDAGCEFLPVSSGGRATGRKNGSAGLKSPRAGAGRGGGARNFHPTVKPVALMRWLCRLITPPKGIVLDPFVGSGTTGVAASLEGFGFVGIEREQEYVQIAQARLAPAASV